MLRKTKSPVTYFQQIGRVVNDDEPIVFDFINNQSHLYQAKREYDMYRENVVNSNRCDKIMFEDCISLIDETVEIEEILHKYNLTPFDAIEEILQNNIKFMENNGHEYTMRQMAKQLNISYSSFILHMKMPKYNHLTFKQSPRYNTKQVIEQNIEYIENNPRGLTNLQLAEELGLSIGAFNIAIKQLNLNISHKTEDKYTKSLNIIMENKKYIESVSGQISYECLAKQLGIGRTQMKNIMNDLNINFVGNKFVRNMENKTIQLIEQNKEYIKNNCSTMSITQMAKKFNINPSTFRRYIGSYNFKFKCDRCGNQKGTTRYNKDIIQIIKMNKEYIELNPDNLSYEDIAKRFNISYSTLCRYCKYLGINMNLKKYYKPSKFDKYIDLEKQYIEQHINNSTYNSITMYIINKYSLDFNQRSSIATVLRRRYKQNN